MKYINVISLGCALIIMVSVPTAVLAQVSDSDTDPVITSDENNVSAQDRVSRAKERIQSSADERKAEREARIEELSVERQNRIEERCVAAQTILETKLARVEVFEARHAERYGLLLERMNAFVERLEHNDIDASVLKGSVEELGTMVDAYFADLAELKAAIGDAIEIDCAADPEAFHLALEDAKLEVDEAKAAWQAVHDYVKGSVREVLQAIRDSLSLDSVGSDV